MTTIAGNIITTQNNNKLQTKPILPQISPNHISLQCENLDLSNQNLTVETISTFTEKFSQLNNLKQLNLSNNSLTTLPEEFKNCFSSSPLIKLDLSNNPFNNNEFLKITDILSNITTLIDLKITITRQEEALSILSEVPQLQRLNDKSTREEIEVIDIDDEDIEHISLNKEINNFNNLVNKINETVNNKVKNTEVFKKMTENYQVILNSEIERINKCSDTSVPNYIYAVSISGSKNRIYKFFLDNIVALIIQFNILKDNYLFAKSSNNTRNNTRKNSRSSLKVNSVLSDIKESTKESKVKRKEQEDNDNLKNNNKEERDNKNNDENKKEEDDEEDEDMIDPLAEFDNDNDNVDKDNQEKADISDIDIKENKQEADKNTNNIIVTKSESKEKEKEDDPNKSSLTPRKTTDLLNPALNNNINNSNNNEQIRVINELLNLISDCGKYLAESTDDSIDILNKLHPKIEEQHEFIKKLEKSENENSLMVIELERKSEQYQALISKQKYEIDGLKKQISILQNQLSAYSNDKINSASNDNSNSKNIFETKQEGYSTAKFNKNNLLSNNDNNNINSINNINNINSIHIKPKHRNNSMETASKQNNNTNINNSNNKVNDHKKQATNYSNSRITSTKNSYSRNKCITNNNSNINNNNTNNAKNSNNLKLHTQSSLQHNNDIDYSQENNNTPSIKSSNKSTAIPQNIKSSYGNNRNSSVTTTHHNREHTNNKLNNVKIMSLKTLLDLINDIYTSKTNLDKKNSENNLPRETLEQHIYTYLNYKYGLKGLVIEYAAALINSIKIYSKENVDVSLFGKIMRNDLEEDYRFIYYKLKITLFELLVYYLKTQHPYKNNAEISLIAKGKTKSELTYEEWNAIVYFLYDEKDAVNIEKKILTVIENLEKKNPKNNNKNTNTLYNKNKKSKICHV